MKGARSSISNNKHMIFVTVTFYDYIFNMIFFPAYFFENFSPKTIGALREHENVFQIKA